MEIEFASSSPYRHHRYTEVDSYTPSKLQFMVSGYKLFVSNSSILFHEPHLLDFGAGNGIRTRTFSLEGCYATLEHHTRRPQGRNPEGARGRILLALKI